MTYEPIGGERIEETGEAMAKMAAENNCEVTADFNDIALKASPGTTGAEIASFYNAECNRQRDEWIASPEYKKQEEEREARRIAHESNLKAALASAPAKMSLKDEEGWNTAVRVNSDPYGSAVARYAEKWARLMEAQIALGKTVAECAEQESQLANDEGITGFMYGCAVNILANVWTHGEELRRWHNKETQLGTEGDEANETGGVLNPALLSIGTK